MKPELHQARRRAKVSKMRQEAQARTQAREPFNKFEEPTPPGLVSVKFDLAPAERQALKVVAAAHSITINQAYRLAVIFATSFNMPVENNRFDFEEFIEEKKGGDLYA